MKKLAVAVIYLLIGLVVGGVLGVFYGAQKIGRPRGRLAVYATAAYWGTGAVHLYKSGNNGAARAALLDYVKTVEEITATPEYRDSPGWRTDIALTLTRLALLEEAEGHPDRATAFSRRAVEEATAGRWNGATEENLRLFVERVDDYNPAPKKD